MKKLAIIVCIFICIGCVSKEEKIALINGYSKTTHDKIVAYGYEYKDNNYIKTYGNETYIINNSKIPYVFEIINGSKIYQYDWNKQTSIIDECTFNFITKESNRTDGKENDCDTSQNLANMVRNVFYKELEGIDVDVGYLPRIYNIDNKGVIDEKYN